MNTQPAATNVIPFTNPPRFDWDNPDTSLLRATQTPVPAFPRKLFGPVWDRWLASVATSKNAPYDYVAASLLTTAAALIGNAREIRVGGWKEPSILWTVLVGNPSSGKSPAMDPLREAIGMLEYDERHSCDDDDSAGPSIQIDDVTAQAAAEVAASSPKGLILFRDELSGWWEKFRQHGGETFWLESYGGRSLSVRRKKQAKLHIPRLSISVLGGSQPDTLRTFLTAKQNRGLAARWLYVCPAPVRAFKLGKAVNIELAHENLGRLRDLQLVNGRPVVVDLARQAKPRFEAWAAAKAAQSWDDDESVWGQWIGKQRGFAMRMALVLEHLWWAADPKGRPEGPGQVRSSLRQSGTRAEK